MSEATIRLRKYKGEQSIYWLTTAASIGVWGYYYDNYTMTIQLFNEKFLPYVSIIQVSLSCAILLLYILTKRKPKFLKIYQMLFGILTIILLSDIILLIGLWIANPSLFESENKGTQCVVCSAQLAIIFSLYLVYIEIKVQKLMLFIQDLRFDLLRSMLANMENEIHANQEPQPEQKKARVNSILPQDMNMAYGNQCTICDEETDMEQKAVQLECLHIFHSECIRKWLDNSKICPNCRREVSIN